MKTTIFLDDANCSAFVVCDNGEQFWRSGTTRNNVKALKDAFLTVSDTVTIYDMEFVGCYTKDTKK